MANQRVRVGSRYRYEPVMLDLCSPPYGVETGQMKKGDTVKVVNQHGCPPANTMGMCYVEKDGEFMGMVCTNSLRKV